MSLRLAIVADIHHGAPSHTKRGDAALGLMAEFSSFVKDAKPDLVIDLGDRISDVDHETDRHLQAEVAEAFKAIDVPIQHICGNHDRDHLSVAENEAFLGQELASRTIDINGWRIAFWRADSKIERKGDQPGFKLPEADLLWLSHMAQTADRPTLVVSHVPVSDHAQTGNYYFERNKRFSTYPEAARSRAALAQTRQPMVCLAGHVHWNTVTSVDGITHLTQQSLTESFTTQGEPAGAYGLMELSDTVFWQVFGKDPFEVRFTPQNHRWTPPLGPFFQEG
ncbi:metallophosphoesterase family protein [Hoeflea prorocentri]|uniref:Metallophosphoesterase n=1 Tax=Hoeflea prorocentri TaxID=1922333 RepID=A0A9X3UIW6_9HYPH|nr:metallophosphoesterase [Hoeflea prorocentri]MCY6382172.1 metallophosphoesterase [Hoeflea prorocentri]MDA5399972.1 metallophosphoesterase [Hoeflea prorocentri]